METTVIVEDSVSALALLQAVYRNPSINLQIRIRCAAIALPFEAPKLAVTAVINEQNFAEVLDRRLKKLREMENGSKAVAIDGPKPEIEIRPPMPRVTDRRYRRM
jgi:hypothetical protein